MRFRELGFKSSDECLYEHQRVKTDPTCRSAMEVYDQLVDPTTVSHSLTAHLTSSDRLDLVVVKNTVLQVFNILQDKFVLINEFKLQGQVLSVEKVKIRGSPLDKLAVLTKFAKLSIVSYDLETNTLETETIHFYELELKKQHLNDISEASLRMEPTFRAALCFHKDILAFLPLNPDDDLDMDDAIITDSLLKSVIIPSSKLDSSIHDIIDCQFLHNHRDPTLAILYNQELTWAADLSIKKDTVNLVVLNLDLTTGSSTPIINLEKLPYDIWSVKSLPGNGFLLLGCNELIHVDNSGNTRGIGLNAYYKDCTDYRLEDQSELDIFLEDCVVEVVGTTVLIADKYGTLYTLNFQKDGKTIRKISLVKNDTQFEIKSPVSMTALQDFVFVGNMSSDSILLKGKKVEGTIANATVTTQKDDDDDDDDDDDLYDDANKQSSLVDALEFEVTDTLINHGPIASFTLARLSPEHSSQGLENPNYNDLSIVGANGEGSAGKITCFNPTLQPKVHSTLKFQNITKCWNLLNKYLITTDLSNFKSEIFLINDNFKNFQTLDFRNNNVTINIAVFQQSQRIVQVTSSNLYIFDYNFKKHLQMNADFEILHAQLLDPYIILTSASGEIRIFEIDTKGRKLNKIKLPKSLTDIILTYGTISNTTLLSTCKRTQEDESVRVANPIFLVTTVNNQILAFKPNHADEVLQFSDVHKLIEFGHVTAFENPEGLIPDPFFKQVEIVQLGDEIHKEEILTVLTIGGEVLMYKLIGLKFQKLESNIISGAPENVYPQSTILERKLIPYETQGMSCLFVSGLQPYVIIKTRISKPKIFKFTHTSLISLCPYDGKFMFIDEEKNARVCSIPFDSTHDYSSNLAVEVFKVGKTVNNIAFHETSNLLIASSLREIPYDPKDEEGNVIVGTEDKRRACSYKSTITLIKPTSWTVLDELEFDDEIVVNSLKSLYLTISSRSKKKKEFVLLGTAKYRLEDLTVLGAFQLYDVISIVPDPEHPDVDYKLKEIVSEVVKGGVTAVTEISGRFLVSQGQKVLIRDLQQDNSTVPVAFKDTPTTLSDAKSFENLVLVSDTLKNVMFLGFDAEPYRLLMLGKSLNELNVSSCDFLVSNGTIHFLVADDEGTLHLISYDPDDPKSLSGQRLLNKTTFHINTLTTTMRLLPKHEEFKPSSDSFQVIGANTDGSLFKVTPIDDTAYRRLYILQQQLGDKLAQYCGLNPRGNRLQYRDAGVKPVIDFELIRRFVHLNLEKRLQFSGKVGKRAYPEIWRDIIEIENTLKNLHQ